MNNSLVIFQDEKVLLVTLFSVMEEKLNIMGSENIILIDKFMNGSIAQLKGKNEISNLQLELEEKLKNC